MNTTVPENPKATLVNLVNLAIGDIRDEAACFIKEDKANYDPNKEDIVTSADKRAQARYVGNLTSDFPRFGIIGEEDGLKKPSFDEDHPIYFTVDPLDGTKAFARHQSHGVGTMLALVGKDEVWAALVGDVNTGEIFGYYGDEPVTRIRFGVEKELRIDAETPLKKLNLLFDDAVYEFPKALQALARSPKEGGIFKGYEVCGGSVGLLHSRLWIGEIGAIVLKSAFDTPWDNTPIMGINKKLGFKHMKFDPETNACEVFEPGLPTTVRKKGYVEFVAHESKVEEILTWISQNT